MDMYKCENQFLSQNSWKKKKKEKHKLRKNSGKFFPKGSMDQKSNQGRKDVKDN